MVIRVLAAFLTLFATASVADEPSMFASRRVGNFNVWLMLLPLRPEEVVAKWNTPRAETFGVEGKEEVPVESPLSVVTLFGGAAKQDGKVQLHCKTTLLPEGGDPQVSFDGACFDQAPEGPDTDIYLAGGSSHLTVPDFLEGKTLVVQQSVTDVAAQITITLEASVRIVAKRAVP